MVVKGHLSGCQSPTSPLRLLLSGGSSSVLSAADAESSGSGASMM